MSCNADTIVYILTQLGLKVPNGVEIVFVLCFGW